MFAIVIAIVIFGRKTPFIKQGTYKTDESLKNQSSYSTSISSLSLNAILSRGSTVIITVCSTREEERQHCTVTAHLVVRVLLRQFINKPTSLTSTRSVNKLKGFVIANYKTLCLQFIRKIEQRQQ